MTMRKLLNNNHVRKTTNVNQNDNNFDRGLQSKVGENKKPIQKESAKFEN